MVTAADHQPPARFADAVDQLHDLVAQETGSSDFGPADYLPGLTVLLQSMDYDPRFTTAGRMRAWAEVTGVLKGRVQAIASMKANPGFVEAPVPSPVVIIGVPRTGTTALHRLMAVDPRFQGLQSWLLDSPMPRPPADTWESYPEYRKTVAAIAARYAAMPSRRAAHHMAAEEVHECCMMLRQGFVSNLWNCSWSAPSYDAWWQCQSEAPAYDYYARCVKLIGSTSPEKRWLLKNPGHVDNLDLLLAVFPDARVIQTHRDPAKAVPSLVSLLMQMHPLLEDPARAPERGKIMMRREIAKWARSVERCEAVRRRHPGQVLDVVHADFHARPMAVLEDIYRFIGMDIPDDTRAGFTRRIEDKPELAHGVHRYRIEDYGMNADEARAPFADYIRRHDLLENRS